jgi:hypothetical protein
MKVILHTYSNEELQKIWLGYVEPKDKSWILFIPAEGEPVLFTERDSVTGAVKEQT